MYDTVYFWSNSFFIVFFIFYCFISGKRSNFKRAVWINGGMFQETLNWYIDIDSFIISFHIFIICILQTHIDGCLLSKKAISEIYQNVARTAFKIDIQNSQTLSKKSTPSETRVLSLEEERGTYLKYLLTQDILREIFINPTFLMTHDIYIQLVYIDPRYFLIQDILRVIFIYPIFLLTQDIYIQLVYIDPTYFWPKIFYA